MIDESDVQRIAAAVAKRLQAPLVLQINESVTEAELHAMAEKLKAAMGTQKVVLLSDSFEVVIPGQALIRRDILVDVVDQIKGGNLSNHLLIANHIETALGRVKCPSCRLNMIEPDAKNCGSQLCKRKE